MQHSKWINEETACEWLGTSRSWLIKNRDKVNIRYSYLGNKRVLMYDKASIEKVLETNAIQNLIQKQTSK
jgi:hypothetical protein